MTHPITPSPELVQQWLTEFFGDGAVIAPGELSLEIANRAAQWGADQELEACCNLFELSDSNARDFLQSARRPKPPSLKEQALQALGRFSANAHTNADEMVRDFDLLRRAVEKLDD